MNYIKILAFVAITLALSFVASTVMAEAIPVEPITHSVTVNGIELQVVRQDDPVEGLESYLLRAVADFGDLNTFMLVEPVIEGAVHQCEPYFGGQWRQTVLLKDMDVLAWASSGWTALHTAADTHILLGPSVLVFPGPTALTEGNDGDNPYHLADHGGTIRIGLGDLAGGGDTSYNRLSPFSGSQLDLMQVVIPQNTQVRFTGRVTAFLGGLETISANFAGIPIGVPEPGAIAMLVASGLYLGLVVVRRRRR